MFSFFSTKCQKCTFSHLQCLIILASRLCWNIAYGSLFYSLSLGWDSSQASRIHTEYTIISLKAVFIQLMVQSVKTRRIIRTLNTLHCYCAGIVKGSPKKDTLENGKVCQDYHSFYILCTSYVIGSANSLFCLLIPVFSRNAVSSITVRYRSSTDPEQNRIINQLCDFDIKVNLKMFQ